MASQREVGGGGSNEFHCTKSQKWYVNGKVLKMIIAVILHHRVTSSHPSFVFRQFQSISSSCFLTLNVQFVKLHRHRTQEDSHSTSQPAESTLNQYSFNQVHYKGPSDANLSNTTVQFCFFFFSSSISLYHIVFFIKYCSQT